MGRLDELEYTRYPNNGAVWKSVSYSVGTAYAQVDLGRGTGDALWTPLKYDHALKYAPNWQQLKEAREAAAKHAT
jgi:hypothetical protein